jgi:hypothetical protein
MYYCMRRHLSFYLMFVLLKYLEGIYYCRFLVTLAVVEGSYHLSRSGGGGGGLISLSNRG